MDCSICFHEITSKTGKTIMACGHEFHFRCLNEWFVRQHTNSLTQNCPCCRHEASHFEKVSIFESPDYSHLNMVATLSDLNTVLSHFGASEISESMWQSLSETQHLYLNYNTFNAISISLGGNELPIEYWNNAFEKYNLYILELNKTVAKIQALWRGYSVRIPFKSVVCRNRICSQ